jgi:hypothetical protein
VQRDVEWRRTLLELCLDMLQTSRPRPGQTMVIVQRDRIEVVFVDDIP